LLGSKAIVYKLLMHSDTKPTMKMLLDLNLQGNEVSQGAILLVAKTLHFKNARAFRKGEIFKDKKL